MAITLLTINDRRGVGSFAQGGIYREYIMVTADDVLTAGNCIRVSPALFDSTFQADQVLPKKYHWKLIYTTTGEFTMAPPTFVIDKYKNVIIKIKFFTDQIFEIKFEWIAIADMGRYLYPFPYQPRTLWESYAAEKLLKYNAYNTADKLLGVRITVDVADVDPPDNLAFIQQDYPVQGKPWTIVNNPSIDNRYFLEADGDPVNGFVLGSDLTVRFRNFPRYTNCQYFAGIYRLDKEAFINGAFYDEMAMQYAKANNTADEPFEFTSGVIDRNLLKDMHGFRYDHFESIADFTIDAAYFEAGGQYRIFLITKEECIYKSYLFDPFEEKTSWNSPEGDITIPEVSVDGVVIDTSVGSCLYNVPTGCEMIYQFRFDIPSYEADLVTKGITAPFEDFFREAKAYISESTESLGSEVDGQVVDVVITPDDNVLVTYSFKIPTDWAGLNKYVNVEWIFDYLNGEVDHLASYVLLNVKNDNSIFIQNPDPLPESYCEVDAIDTEFCFSSLEVTEDHKFFFDTINEGQVIPPDDVIIELESDFSTGDDACVTFKYPLISTNQEYCIRTRAWKATNDSDGSEPCTDIVIKYNRHFFRPTNAYFIYDILGWTDAEILTVSVAFFDINGNAITGFETHNEAEYYKLLQLNHNPVFISITVYRVSGEVYSTGKFLFTWHYEAFAGDTTELTVDLCVIPTVQDCEENPVLSSTVVWNYITPPPDAALTSKTITAVETNFGAATVTRYKILNGTESAYTVPFTVGAFVTVSLRFELDYGDGCVLELYDCLTEQEASIP